jgi:hypothetical protein
VGNNNDDVCTVFYIIYLLLDYMVSLKQFANPDFIIAEELYSFINSCFTLTSILIFCFLEVNGWIKNLLGNKTKETDKKIDKKQK